MCSTMNSIVCCMFVRRLSYYPCVKVMARWESHDSTAPIVLLHSPECHTIKAIATSSRPHNTIGNRRVHMFFISQRLVPCIIIDGSNSIPSHVSNCKLLRYQIGYCCLIVCRLLCISDLQQTMTNPGCITRVIIHGTGSLAILA